VTYTDRIFLVPIKENVVLEVVVVVMMMMMMMMMMMTTTTTTISWRYIHGIRPSKLDLKLY